MLLELDEDMRELIFEEVENFSISYATLKKLTNEDLVSESAENSYKLYSKYNNVIFIKRYSRTKISFSFVFESKERELAMSLLKIIDGFVDYSFRNSGSYTNYFHVSFNLDIGAKKNCQEFFQRIFGETFSF